MSSPSFNHFRDFSLSDESIPPVRNVDSDAPREMRNELVDLFFHLIEHSSSSISPDLLYRIICQSLGETASGKPCGGYRYASGRDAGKADWQRIYDLICRLWPEFVTADVKEEYRNGVNRILGAYGIVWELNESGQLRRVLPREVNLQIAAAMAELSQQNYAPARTLLHTALDAYHDRPRQDRDACANVFDAMESVAKENFQLPNATFGAVLAHIRKTQGLQTEVIDVLEKVNTLRNHKFGHGMTVPFDLSSAEGDFTYLSCIAGILLFVRTRQAQQL
ncbi:hypothetical protein KJ068_16415 [bacterium]|nr:hypothetical protein [bacterium]